VIFLLLEVFIIRDFDTPHGQSDKNSNISSEVMMRFHMKIVLCMGFLPLDFMAKLPILLPIN
jgi:hypothetical protein